MKGINFLIILSISLFFNIQLLKSQEKNNKSEPVISQIEDSITINNLINTGLYYSKSDLIKAKIYFKEAENISIKTGYKKGLADSYYNSGLVYKNLGEKDSAFYFFNSSLFFNRRINNKKGVIKCLNEIASYYQESENYGEAIRNYFKSLDILIDLKDPLSIAQVYHNLGLLYLELELNKKALDYCIKAYNIETEYNDTNAFASSLFNIGKVYYSLDSIKKAQYFYNQSLDINKKIENKYNVAKTYLGIGQIYDRKQKYNEASQVYNNAITLLKNCMSANINNCI